MQVLVKKKAPVQVTGGGGFRYENAVAARARNQTLKSLSG